EGRQLICFRLGRRSCRRGSAGRDTDHLELVKRLASHEVHVLARTEIGSPSKLARKKGSVGPQGRGSATPATALVNALGVAHEPQHLDASTAIERLKQGTIDAAVIVGDTNLLSALFRQIPASISCPFR